MKDISPTMLFTKSPVADPVNKDRRWRMVKGTPIHQIASMIVDRYIMEKQTHAAYDVMLNEGGMHLTSSIGPEGYYYVFFAFDKPVLKDGVYTFGFMVEGHYLTLVDDGEFVDNIAGVHA